MDIAAIFSAKPQIPVGALAQPRQAHSMTADKLLLKIL
jgi:hypothetical protein